MDKIPNKVTDSIRKLILSLEKNNFPIGRAVLFGSYANGSAGEFSDIDLALVSDSFTGERFLDKERIREIVVSVDTDISPFPFRPEDFSLEDLFASEIIKTGVEIDIQFDKSS